MKLVKFKDDLYVPEDFAKNHNYYADPEGTKAYTGITSILGVLAKPALIQWAANEACKFVRENVAYAIPGEDGGFWAVKPSHVEEARTAHARKKDRAAEHGTDAHALVEMYVNFCIKEHDGKPYPETNAPIQAFMDWAVANVDHFIFAERRMANPDLFIAGTADFGCVMKDGKKLMGDFKTSSAIWDEYWYQVGGYCVLAEGEGDAPYDGLVIARLGKDGKFEAKHMYDLETAKEGFMSCLKLYRANAALKGLVVN